MRLQAQENNSQHSDFTVDNHTGIRYHKDMKTSTEFGIWTLPATQGACAHGVPFAEPCHAGDCFRDGQEDKAVLVHAFIQRHLAGGADNYAIALLLEKAGYTFRDLADALIAGRGM